MENVSMRIDELFKTESMKEYILHGVIPVLLNEKCERANTYLAQDALTDRFFADMKVFFIVKVGEVKDGNTATFALTKQIAAAAGLSFIEIADKARENAAERASFGAFVPPMHVLTNHDAMFGAGSALCKDVLKKMYEEIGKFYLLPSSIHEWVIIPAPEDEAGSGMDPESLKQMVYEINRSSVISADDFLSDQVLFYDGDTLREA